MLFPSVPFLAFFAPLFLLAYLLLPWRNLTFLLFNLLFYFWGEDKYIGVLLASITLNYFAGVLIGRSTTPQWRKYSLILGITLNCLLFFYYKYFAFFVIQVLPDLGGIAPDEVHIPHLPLGISFFTFQGISYLMDIYRNEAEYCRSWFDLALYKSMFPQLIAGPIVRFHHVAKALTRRHLTFDRISFGTKLFVIGFAQKVLIANNLGSAVDRIFGYDPSKINALVAWAGVSSYALQIFFDFSGYSNMAIGMGVMLGFRFPRNFRYPYISQSLTEFWRRWHISLSTWFRDYLYIPLGGNRKGTPRTLLNLLIIFVLCGLWHGAAYTFLFWGLFHGTFLILERIGLKRMLAKTHRAFRHCYALTVILISWVFFRADTLDRAFAMLRAMFGLNGNYSVETIGKVMNHEQQLAFVLGLLFATPLIDQLNKKIWGFMATGTPNASLAVVRSSWRLITLGAIFLLSYTYVLAGTYNPFLYFRF